LNDGEIMLSENTLVKILAGTIPQWLKRHAPQGLKNRISRRLHYIPPSPSDDYLRSLMCKYQIKDLITVDSQAFKKRLDEFLQLQDYEMEGFKSPEKQRDLSVKFHWGHNHDFGEFFVEGRMGDRHISLLATFIDGFKVLPKSLDGLKVLDIGCWTGGTSLLLCAMGAHVVAIEEVKKYVDLLHYLQYAFDLDRLEPKNLSLYECTTPEFQDSFDIILFAGVLYHVTDPVLALRISFNALRNGGICLLETAAIDSNKPILSYERHRWNWFIPSQATLHQMMTDVGYIDVQVGKVVNGRVFAVGKRGTHIDMMRGGLSARTIR